MSLILEALKKLEREKEVPERGFVVVGSTALAPASRAGRWLAFLAVAAVAAAAAFLPWRKPAPRARTAVATPASPAPAVVPAPPVTVAPAPPAPSPLPPVARAPASSPAPAARTSPAGEPSPAPELRLQAISQRDGRPIALLNDRLVREGDGFDGVLVVRIGTDEVEVELAGKRILLRF